MQFDDESAGQSDRIPARAVPSQDEQLRDEIGKIAGIDTGARRDASRGFPLAPILYQSFRARMEHRATLDPAFAGRTGVAGKFGAKGVLSRFGTFRGPRTASCSLPGDVETIVMTFGRSVLLVLIAGVFLWLAFGIVGNQSARAACGNCQIPPPPTNCCTPNYNISLGVKFGISYGDQVH